MENFHETFEPEHGEQFRAPQETPRRLMKAIELMLKLNFKRIEVTGREHLAELTPEQKVIVVPTHITDFDVPVAIHELGNDLNFEVTHESVQDEVFKDPKAYAINQLAGQENFLPLQYSMQNGEKVAGFNEQDYVRIKKVLDGGEKSVAVAAHNPSKQKSLEEPGYAAVYLAQLVDNAVLLPVAVDVQKSGVRRGEVNVTIDSPMSFPRIPGIERFAEILQKRKAGEKLTKSEIEEFSGLRKALKAQSEQLSAVLAKYIPQEKQQKKKHPETTLS